MPSKGNDTKDIEKINFHKSTDYEKAYEKWKKEVPRTPLFLQDETLSTFEAKERMKQLPQYNFKIDLKRVDELAASIILEAFLEKINLDQSNWEQYSRYLT